MKNPMYFTRFLFCLFSYFMLNSLLPGDALAHGSKSSSAIDAETMTMTPPVCSTPTWPSTYNITQSTATFSWSSVYGALSYSVQTRLPNGTWYNLPGSPFTSTSVTATGLTPGTTYEWRVRANCNYGDYSNWTYPITFTTLGGSCYAPDWLTTTNITHNTATFDWSAAPNAVSYSIQWRYSGGNWQDLGGGPWVNTWVAVGGLQSGTTYEWRVRSNCYGGNYSNWSSAAVFTTQGYTCNTPTWPSTSNITQTSATFSWSSVSGAVSYTVQTRLPNGTWYDAPGGPFYNTSVTVNGFSPNTTYQWRVRANCSGGQYSAWTYPINFTTTGGSYCNAPYWLNTTNITSTSAELSWSSVNGALSYSIQYRLAGGTWYDLQGGPWTATWHTITGLTPGTAYEWRVRSNCYSWNMSPWSYAASFTTSGYSCGTPTWPSTSYVTQNSATFSWSSVWGAQSYTVQTRLLNGTWYDAPGGPIYGTSYTINGLTPNTTYQWRVRANCNGGGYSYWTSPITFTTSGGYYCTAPEWLSTNNISQTSATLDWDAVNGALSYSLQYRVWGGSWTDIPGGPWTQTWYNLTGLTPGTTYEWRVRSNCYNWNMSPWSYPDVFTTLGVSCSTPTWPSTYNITQTGATFSWSSVWGAVSYTVQTRLLNGNWYDVPGGPFYNTSVTVNGLSPNTTYQWRVRANCSGGGYSNWTSPITFTTLGGSCNAPYWLNTSNITQTSAELSWASVSGALSYTVQYRLAGGTWYDVPGGPTTENWYTINGLEPGTHYEWRVRSNCYNWNMSPWSFVADFTTLNFSCGVPTWPSTSNITSTSATFSWSSVSGATSYTIQTRLPNGTWYDVPGGPFGNTSVNVNGFNPGTTYQWRVRANCGYGNYSYWTSPVTFTTLGGSCNAPYWLGTTNITSTSATLDWSSVSGVMSYDLQYRLTGGSWYDVPGGPFTSTWHTLTGLQPGTSYEWRVRSNCYGGGESAWSYPSGFTTLGGYSCDTPTWPSTSNVTQTTATFSWSGVSGAISYSLQTRLLNGTWYDVPNGPFYSTTVTVSGFDPGTTYQWRVKANCSGGQYSNWTSPVTFTTLGGYSCDTPTWPSTSNVTQTTATFSWSGVSGAISYSLQTRLLNGTWYDVPNGPFYSTIVTVSGFNPGTTYQWRVKANCSGGQYSNWTSPITFTTSGGNGGYGIDECSGAVLLAVGSSCNPTYSSNVNATASTPAPEGGCYSINYKDVWFKFAMPSYYNPSVTIRTTAGSLTDAVMEVYMGDNCGNLYYIDCEDDNINGNGSPMPVINLTGYDGNTIWVRVWGYAGNTGTFNICVFNYESNNYASPDVSEQISFDGESIEEAADLAPQMAGGLDVLSTLRVAPNPTRDVLQVTYAQTDHSTIMNLNMMDLAGKIVLSRNYEPTEIIEFQEQLDVSSLIPGMYILQVVTSNGILTEKIMVVE